MTKFKQGKFKPLNPQKYIGDVNDIMYRSSWELKFMLYLDKHPDILQWNSEGMSINYLNPVDRKVHRYFPDFLIKKRNRDGSIETVLIEIKPSTQSQQPSKPARITKSYKRALVTWAVNEAKWNQAEKWCAEKGIKFQVLTEHDLGLVK